MNVRGLLLCLIATHLLLASILSIPLVDHVILEDVQALPFFYARSLPFTYYVTMAYLCLLALLSRSNITKMFSLLLLVALTVMSPIIMFKNIIMQDGYSYLSEAIWLVRHGHVANINNLEETPGFGLLFSQLMLVSGLGYLEISKLFPMIFVLVTPLMALTSSRVYRDYALLPLLFLAYLWDPPIVPHRSSCFIFLVVLMIYLLLNLHRSPSFIIAYMVTITTIVITYSGIIALIIALLSSAFLPRLLKKSPLTSREIAMVSLMLFLVWGIWISKADFPYIVKSVYYGLQSFTLPTDVELLKIGYGVEGSLTTAFKTITYMRIVEILFLGTSSVIVALYSILQWYRNKGPRDDLLFHFLYLNLVVIVISFITLHKYKWFALKFERVTIYLATLSLSPFFRWTFSKSPKHKLVIACTIILVPLLLSSLTSFPALPVTHAPSSELVAKDFVVRYGGPRLTIYMTEYSMPWLFHEVMLDKSEAPSINLMGPPRNYEVGLNYLVVQRYLGRDGYFHLPLTHREFLANLTSLAVQSHNVVYCINNYTKIFLTRS